MNTCTLLDNSMFDDGSMEYKTFTIATQERFYISEWTGIVTCYSVEVQRQIRIAMANGQRYITLAPQEHETIEISWD